MHALQVPPVALLIDEVLKISPTINIDKAELSSHVKTWGSTAKARCPDIPFSGEWCNFEEFIVSRVTIFPWDFRLPRDCRLSEGSRDALVGWFVPCIASGKLKETKESTELLDSVLVGFVV